jgi:hypothetical protein
MENGSPLVLVENGRVKPTTLRPIIVDGTPFTVVKDASSIQILEP